MVDPHFLVLAAGLGRRMRSPLPKVLHPVLFRPMLHHVLDLAYSLPRRSVTVVVGHGETLVRRTCAGYPELRFVSQPRPDGSGDAVRRAEPELGLEGDVVVLSGDVVMLSPGTLLRLIERHRQAQALATVATARPEDTRGYGRVLLDGERFVGVREEADCSEAERDLREVNAGVYCFRSAALFDALRRLSPRNAHGEYYLPEALGLLAEVGPVARVMLEDPAEMAGINDMEQLWRVEDAARARHNGALMRRGVRLDDPRSTTIDPRCPIGRGVRVGAGATVIDSELADGVEVESFCRISRSSIGPGTRVRQGSCIEESVVGARCAIGPYAHLRAGSWLEKDVRAGNFVELKKSRLGAGTKVSHLSYIGDAEFGRRVNVGCGFITCNFDGVSKRRTVVGDDVFIGSDCQTVAPVQVAGGSFIACGTTVTEEVPPESLVISRGRQVTKPGYARKYRARAQEGGSR